MATKDAIKMTDEMRTGRRALRRKGGPLVNPDDLEKGYQAMAADEEAEREALEWIEGTVGDVAYLD